MASQIELADLYKAYYECRIHKRRTVNALDFELNFENNIIKLWHDINSGTYKVNRSIAFVVSEPVKREIFAADFRDRVVHHLVIDKINPLFEADFITDSYSCRSGKGTLFGVKKVLEKIRQCSSFGTKDCYILKLDIRSFFMSINKTILYRRLDSFLCEKYTAPDRDLILRLIRQIIFNSPQDNCHIKGKISDWNGLPCYKSLFWSDDNHGLPIGNLTSQVFANFYLNALDKFITQDLGIKYYGRYVDDFVIIHEDKDFLTSAHQKIARFLSDELKLQLHPQKVYLQHYSKGVRFIGAFIKHDHIIIGKRTKANLYNKIHRLLPEMAQNRQASLSGLPHFNSSINS